jgi:hypothetical protein
VEVVSFFSFFGAAALLEVIGFAKPMPKKSCSESKSYKKRKPIGFLYLLIESFIHWIHAADEEYFPRQT